MVAVHQKRLGRHTEAAGHSGSIFGVAVSPAAPHLVATASDDETVRLWEDREHEGAWAQAASAAVADSAMCSTFSPDGRQLAAGTSDGVAHLYAVSCGSDSSGAASLEATACLREHPEEVYACEFLTAADGTLCTASDDSLFLWDLEASRQLQRAGPPTVPADQLSAAMPERWRAGYVFSLRQQPGSGRLLAASCSDGAVRMWEAGCAALSPLWGVRLHDSIGSACAFSADGLALVSLSRTGEIVVLDIRQRAELACVAAPMPLHGCCLLPDGRLAACGADGAVVTIDISGPTADLEVVSSSRTERRESLFCIATAGEGAPLVACGEAIIQVPPPAAAEGEPAVDPLFDEGQLLTNGSGARIVFTTAEATKVQSTPAKSASVHVWQS